MATNTPNLNLLKKDPATDGNETFNIKTMLNDNWDKIDAAVGNINIPDATTTVKGKVQLSSATDSDSEAMAATPKAVKDASLQAKSYTDQQINLVTATGIPKLVSYPLKVIATADNQTVFEIPLDLFDANTDTLMVAINRAALDPTQYTVTNTVLNQAGEVTQRAKITLLSGVTATSEVTMVVLKNVPIGKDGAINGAVLAVDSVPINRVSGLQEKLDAELADNTKHVPHLGTTTNVGDAYSITTVETINANQKFTIKFNVASVSAPTLKINTGTAYSIKKANGNAAKLYASVYTLFFDGSAFILLGEGGEYGNATATQVLSPNTIGTENGIITGTMPNQGSKISTLTTQGQQYIIPQGFHDGTGKITASFANLVAGNVRDQVNIGGVVGSLQASIAGSATVNVVSPYPVPVGMTDLPVITFPKGIHYFAFTASGTTAFYSNSSIDTSLTIRSVDDAGTVVYETTLFAANYSSTVQTGLFMVDIISGNGFYNNTYNANNSYVISVYPSYFNVPTRTLKIYMKVNNKDTIPWNSSGGAIVGKFTYA